MEKQEDIMQLLIESGKSIYSIYAVMALGFAVKILETLFYKRILRHSENIENTRNKYFVQLRQRFENCYRSNSGVTNIEVFVDKYILKIKMLGISWKKWNSSMLFIGIICTSMGLVYGYFAYTMKMLTGVAANNIFNGIICGAFIFLLYYFSDMEYKKNIIKINIRDFLENNYIHKLEASTERSANTEKLSEEEKQKLMESINELKKETERIENSRKRKNAAVAKSFSKDNEKLLNDILQEYFS